MKKSPLPKITKRRKAAPRVAPKKRRGANASKAHRWSLHAAGREFGIARELMERQRRALHVEPGSDRCFSTKQICALVFGDKQLADTRRAEAEAEAAQRKNQREAGELIPTAVAVALVEPIMVVIRQKICASSLTDPEKDDMLADLERAKEMDWGKAAKEAMR